VYALIFITERANSPKVYLEYTNLYGALISVAPDTQLTLNYSDIIFDSTVIKNLANRFSIINQPTCETPLVKGPMLFTAMEVD